MTDNYPQEPADSAASFERRPNRWLPPLIGAAVAFAIFAIAVTGFALTRTPGEAIAADVELTTTTTVAPAESTTTIAETTTTTEAPVEEPAEEAPIEEPVEEPAEEPEAEEPAPEPDPDPAHLVADDVVDLGTATEGTFTIQNVGDESLTIDDVTVPLEVTMDPHPMSLDGGESFEASFTIDTGDMELGPYSFEITIDAGPAGTETVTVDGEKKFFVFLPPVLLAADIDVQDLTVVPHGSPIAPISIMNNEDHNVTVTLTSNHARLTLPGEVVLTPGANVINGTVGNWGGLPWTSMHLGYTVEWFLGSENANILKFGA